MTKDSEYYKKVDYYKELIDNNRLPEHFNQWLMTDKNGSTIAHYAADYGNLPENWTIEKELWLLVDNNGNTIAHIAASSSSLPLDWTDNPEDWLICDDQNFTVAHCAASTDSLPSDWIENNKQHLFLINGYGMSIAHYLAIHNTLMLESIENRDDLLIKNAEGKTVGYYFYQHKNNLSSIEDIEEYLSVIDNHFNLLCENHVKNSTHLEIILMSIKGLASLIQKASLDEYQRTSDDYSGFLIDHLEDFTTKIKNNVSYSKLVAISAKERIDMINNCFNEIFDLIKTNKIKVKESLFKYHESKNNAVDHKIPDFSETL